MKNEPKGYGNLTNLIHFERVYMVEHSEGVGTEESPLRKIKTFFTKEGDYLGRIDPYDSRSTGV